jgi:hypothetical protein
MTTASGEENLGITSRSLEKAAFQSIHHYRSENKLKPSSDPRSVSSENASENEVCNEDIGKEEDSDYTNKPYNSHINDRKMFGNSKGGSSISLVQKIPILTTK